MSSLKIEAKGGGGGRSQEFEIPSIKKLILPSGVDNLFWSMELGVISTFFYRNWGWPQHSGVGR